ncbi:MAG: UDP-N-acetylmuramate dehydrogenase, partial [Bacteroidales bacterium]|nr:UDP-N-acetylmuramate dehydrogenase [Bacteroidales bacterium]
MHISDHFNLIHHNTFGIEAHCRRFVEYETADELAEVTRLLADTPQEPWLHIGGGSNLLFTKDFDGTILHSTIATFETIDKGNETLVRV